MAVQAKKQLFTVDDYYKMAEAGIIKPDDRVELINGEIIRMSPIKSLHACMVDILGAELNFQLRGKAIIRVQNPIRIKPYSEPEPDVAIAKFRKDKYRNHHPVPEDIYLVIEVADTTLRSDRTTKQRLYAEAGIPEYWIINLKAQQVEMYLQPMGKEYIMMKTAQINETITCSTIPFELILEELF